jgi:hypothetical protein
MAAGAFKPPVMPGGAGAAASAPAVGSSAAAPAGPGALPHGVMGPMGDYMQMWNKWAQQMPPPGGEGNGGAQ